jgi:NhaP-type Na+/H+ or K+/H+ antiporter
MALTILVIGLLIFFGHVLSALFQRTKVPDVLVLMIAGIVLGPLFHVVTPEDFGKVGRVFTTLALVVILFEGGIHLNLRQLITAAGDTLVITVTTSALTMLLVAHLADVMLPLDFPTALLVGAILSGTSSAVVVPMVRTLGLTGRAGTVLFLESALTDVLVIVLSLGLLQGLVAVHQGSAATLSAATLVWQILSSFLVAALIGVGGAVFWSAVLERIRRFPNTVFTTLAYVFILYGITELAGYSGAIAALTFGVSLANLPLIPPGMVRKVFRFRLTPFADHERAFFAEVVFLVKTFFFVYLGVSVTFTDARAVLTGFVLAAAAFLARAPIIRLLGRADLSRREAALMTALVPKGLAPAVLAGLPLQLGLPGGAAIQGTVYATIFFSIAGCAILVFGVERGLLARALAGWFGKFPLEPAVAAAAPPAPGPAPALATLSSADVADLFEPNPVTDFDGGGSGPERGAG